MFCDGKSYVRGLLQRSTRGPGSEEQLCALSFSTLQTVENVSVNISRRSPVSTLLVSCASSGAVKSSEAGAAIIEKAHGEVDDLLGAVSKLSLCPSTRSVVGVCSAIGSGRGRPKFAKTTFRSWFRKSLDLAHGLSAE